MHGCITSNSTTTDNITTTHLIAAHRAAWRVYLAASAEFDSADDDDASYAAKTAKCLVDHVGEVERRVLDDLLSTVPDTASEVAVLFSYLQEVDQAEGAIGIDSVGRAEERLERLTASVRLMKA